MDDDIEELSGVVGTDVPPGTKECKRQNCPVMEAAEEILFMTTAYAETKGFVVIDKDRFQYYCKRCKEWKWVDYHAQE